MREFLTIGDKATIILEHITNASLQVGETVEDMNIRAICAALETIERMEPVDITNVTRNFIDKEYR